MQNRPSPEQHAKKTCGLEPYTWSNSRPAGPLSAVASIDHFGWFVGVGTFILALMVYASTMCHTVFWWDSGELVANASILGIPHRPGFPFYILVARVFGLPPMGDYFYRINFLSVFCAAAAAGIFCYVLVRLAARFIERRKVVIYSSLLAAAAMIGTYTFWIQAVRAEVYALNALVVAVVILLLERADSSTGVAGRTATRCVYAAAFLFGLGLGGHHATLASTTPAVIILGAVILGRRSFRPGFLLTVIGLFAAGFSIYLYLPLRALQSPLLNWGWDTGSVVDGAQAVMATDAYGYVTGQTIASVARKLFQSANLIIDQVGLPMTFLSLTGLVYWLGKSRRWGLFFLLLAVGNLMMVAILATEFIYWNADLHGYLLPTVFALFVGVAGGFYLLLGPVFRLLHRLIRSHHLCLVGKTALAFVAVMLAITPALIGGPFCNLSQNHLAWDLGLETLIDLPPDAVIIMDGVNWNFVLRGMQFASGLRPDVAIINRSLMPATWYQQQCRRRYPQLFATLNFPAATTAAETITWADQIRATGRPVFWEYTERELPHVQRFQPAGHLFLLTEPDPTVSDSVILAQEHFERASRFYAATEKLRYDLDAQGVYIQNLYRAGMYYERRGLIYRAKQMYQRALSVRPMESTLWVALLRLGNTPPTAADDQ